MKTYYEQEVKPYFAKIAKDAHGGHYITMLKDLDHPPPGFPKLTVHGSVSGFEAGKPLKFGLAGMVIITSENINATIIEWYCTGYITRALT